MVFSTQSDNRIPFYPYFSHPLFAAELEEPKIRISGKVLNVAGMMIYLFDRVEDIVGKGENAGYQHFLLFPQCFQKDFFSKGCKISGYQVKGSPTFLKFHITFRYCLTDSHTMTPFDTPGKQVF